MFGITRCSCRCLNATPRDLATVCGLDYAILWTQSRFCAICRSIRVHDPASDSATPHLREFWAKGPVLVHLVRRFGCPLCREAAADLSALHTSLESAGVTMIAIGCQETGWREFVDGAFFAGPVFVDKEQEAFKALGLRRSGVWDAFGFADWSSWVAVVRSYSRGVVGDLKGDGFQMGGTFVILPSGACVYDHRMQSPGDKPDAAEILNAVTSALAAQKRPDANPSAPRA